MYDLGLFGESGLWMNSGLLIAAFGIHIKLEMAGKSGISVQMSLEDRFGSIPTTSGNHSAFCQHCAEPVYGSDSKLLQGPSGEYIF